MKVIDGERWCVLKTIHIDQVQVEDREAINCFFEKVLRHTFKMNDLTELQELLSDEIEDKRQFLEQCLETQKVLDITE